MVRESRYGQAWRREVKSVQRPTQKPLIRKRTRKGAAPAHPAQRHDTAGQKKHPLGQKKLPMEQKKWPANKNNGRGNTSSVPRCLETKGCCVKLCFVNTDASRSTVCWRLHTLRWYHTLSYGYKYAHPSRVLNTSVWETHFRSILKGFQASYIFYVSLIGMVYFICIVKGE